ncbi:MAG TPA: enolase C-terminal domain-like protein [Burkholderiales bacterium]
MAALTYRSIEVRTVSVPLRRPVVSKVGRFDEWPLILIDLQTAEGVVGRSYLEPYLRNAPRYVVPAIRDLAAARMGQPVRPLDDFRQGRKALNLLGYEGISMIAVAGLDMAAWDAMAKAAGLSLAALLGGCAGEVPAYNSNGLWLGADPRTIGREAAELVGEGGFAGLKLRLGREALAEDLAAIRAVRDAVGEEVKLMVDFNQGLSLAEALHRCRALDDEGLYWLEEPITYNDLDGYAQLTRELRTPVQLGENFYGPRELSRALQAKACDYVMPDLMRIGGVSGWLQAAPIACASGVPVSTHLYPEVCGHLMRITETAHWLEWQDWANPVLAEPFEVRNGRLVVPDRPGCGIAWDAKAVRQYAYDA